jgi:hypothetical protein
LGVLELMGRRLDCRFPPTSLYSSSMNILLGIGIGTGFQVVVPLLELRAASADVFTPDKNPDISNSSS